MFLSDQESEADANSEADNEAETSFSSFYRDDSNSDPSQPLPQFVVSGADLRIRLRRAIEVYVAKLETVHQILWRGARGFGG